MKKKALIFGVILTLLMGFSPILADNTQGTVLIFKLISAKDLAKELRNPDSERIRAFGYLTELDVAIHPLDKWLNLSETIVYEVMSKALNDPEIAEYLFAEILEKSNEPDFDEILLGQNFEFSQFEQEFSKIQRIFTKLITWLQESLDPFQPAHQKAFIESTELLKKINNPALFTQGMPQYQIDCFRVYYIYTFALAWAKKASVTFDENLLQEIVATGAAIQGYIIDGNIDKDSEEFKKIFSEYMTKLNAKLEELIQFIEKL